MVGCIIDGCNNNRGNANISLFRIKAEDAELIFTLARRIDIYWREFVSQRYKDYRICSAHYDSHQFTLTKSGSRRLSEGEKPVRRLTSRDIHITSQATSSAAIIVGGVSTETSATMRPIPETPVMVSILRVPVNVMAEGSASNLDSGKSKEKEKGRKRGKLCSAINCYNYAGDHPNLSFSRFPKDETRCKRWVINARTQHLEKKSTKQLSSNYGALPYTPLAEHSYFKMTVRNETSTGGEVSTSTMVTATTTATLTTSILTTTASIQSVSPLSFPGRISPSQPTISSVQPTISSVQPTISSVQPTVSPVQDVTDFTTGVIHATSFLKVEKHHVADEQEEAPIEDLSDPDADIPEEPKEIDPEELDFSFRKTIDSLEPMVSNSEEEMEVECIPSSTRKYLVSSVSIFATGIV